MIHEFNIGDWRALILLDRASKEQAEGTVRNWPPERLERELRELGEYPEITIDYNILAVQTPQGWLLADGGQGPLTGHTGELVDALAEAGLSPDDISFIFLSHCHADHYGTLVHPQTGALVFPNARYFTSSAEWNIWTNDEQLAAYKEQNFMFYRVVTERLMPIQPHLTLVEPGDTIVPGVTVVDAVGHTAGHMALLVENGGESLLYIGDAAVHPIHLKYVDAIYSNETVPERTPGTRRALIDLARQKNARLLACHFRFPGLFELPDQWPVEG
jgi:glyoxylase-like metal-dependent hydrolase (beta-lactamase superfamily II)